METQAVEQVVKKVKPWKAVVIRVARNEAGDAIRELLVEADVPVLVNTDWNDIFPHWLIATVNDEVIGCLNIAPSKPFGYMNFLCVKQDVSKSIRAVAVKKLLLTAAAQLRDLGSDWAVSFVENKLKSYRNVLKNNGCLLGPQGSAVIKRLRV